MSNNFRFPDKQNTKYFFIENPQNICRTCPICSSEAIKLKELNYFICSNYHKFFACPTCSDTRVKDKQENVYYCGLLHPYHFCAIHQIPVIGPAAFRNDICTCQPEPLVLRKQQIKNWDSPFL